MNAAKPVTMCTDTTTNSKRFICYLLDTKLNEIWSCHYDQTNDTDIDTMADERDAFLKTNNLYIDWDNYTQKSASNEEEVIENEEPAYDDIDFTDPEYNR